jgi:hypothetical protein
MVLSKLSKCTSNNEQNTVSAVDLNLSFFSNIESRAEDQHGCDHVKEWYYS